MNKPLTAKEQRLLFSTPPFLRTPCTAQDLRLAAAQLAQTRRTRRKESRRLPS
jgi:hypothetical protein